MKPFRKRVVSIKQWNKRIRYEKSIYRVSSDSNDELSSSSSMYFPEIDSTLRTDFSFRNCVHEEHHQQEGIFKSLFEELNIYVIHTLPLDYIHLLLLRNEKIVVNLN